MLCGLRLVWRKFSSEIFIDLPISFQYDFFSLLFYPGPSAKHKILRVHTILQTKLPR